MPSFLVWLTCYSATMNWNRRLAALGPGLLFAGAAVGVSHLVQSTRAGAAYGMSLVGIVIAANIMKYPAFRFGPEYAAAANESLLAGYARQGRWALVLYGLLTMATMVTVQAAVTLVSAGVALHLFGLTMSPLLMSAILLILSLILLGIGQYRWLDRVNKVIVALFTVATVVATSVAFSSIEGESLRVVPQLSELKNRDWLFIAALVGWMPSAVDVSVWQSLWTLERKRAQPTLESADIRFDFHVGYFATAVLAIGFLTLGASVMHQSGVSFSAKPHLFAGQLVSMYGQTLGAWSAPILATAVLLVMFSTTLTVVDGFPRALDEWARLMRGRSAPTGSSRRPAYWLAAAFLFISSLLVLTFAIAALKTLVDVATTLSFLTAPLLSWLNHRSICSSHIPVEKQPSNTLRRFSWAMIIAQATFALYYLRIQFFAG